MGRQTLFSWVKRVHLVNKIFMNFSMIFPLLDKVFCPLGLPKHFFLNFSSLLITFPECLSDHPVCLESTPASGNSSLIFLLSSRPG